LPGEHHTAKAFPLYRVNPVYQYMPKSSRAAGMCLAALWADAVKCCRRLAGRAFGDAPSHSAARCRQHAKQVRPRRFCGARLCEPQHDGEPPTRWICQSAGRPAKHLRVTDQLGSARKTLAALSPCEERVGRETEIAAID